MRKMEYELRGLNCADCALKIEKEIAGLDGIDSAQLVFATQKLKLQHLISGTSMIPFTR